MTEESKKNRARSANYTMKEKSLLIHLVEKYKNVIENKQSDTVTWRDKDEAWFKIFQQFNACCPELIYRKKESLKHTYENMKKIIRKDIADEKIQINNTGGGVIKKPSPIVEKVLALIDRKTVTGLYNPYDSDSDLVKNHFAPSTNRGLLNHVTNSAKRKIEYVIDEESENGILDEDNTDEHINNPTEEIKQTLIGADLGNVNPSHLKTPVTAVLATTNRWCDGRKPAIKNQTSSQLAKDYTTLANVKSEVWEIDKENKLIERRQKQELFILQKKNLILDNELKELQIKRFKSQFTL